MILLRVCALLLVCAAPLRADPIRLSEYSAKAEDRLRAWLDQDAGVRAKLGQVAAAQAPAAQAAAPAPFADPDLKDAVAEAPQPDQKAARRQLLSRLPGLAAPQSQGCASPEECRVPPLVMDIAPGGSIEPAIRAMVRPWIWLADERGLRLAVAPAPKSEAGQVLVLKLKGLGPSGTALNIRPRPEGGFHLWFDRAFELAEAYAREQAAAQTQRP